MANWRYTINLRDVWGKYSDLDHEDFDEDVDIFVKMKDELISEVEKQLNPSDFVQAKDIITSLRKSKHLSSFNSKWNQLYDFCDYNRIWLATNF